MTPGGQAVAGSVQVIGNKGIQIATGKFDVTEINSVGDVAGLGLDIATDYFAVAPAATIGSNLASGLQKLAGSYAPSVASGGGSVVKTAAGGTVDDITFSVSLSDEVVVSASKIGGKGVVAKGVVNTVPRTKDVLGHIFRNAPGHVNPATAASQGRYISLFEKVAANSKNLNPSILNPQAAKNGVQAFTQTFRNGQQVWVHTRNGRIFDAGVNLIPK